MISKDKTYRTRDGREVRIYATDGGPTWHIHGAYKSDGMWLLHCWDKIGLDGSRKCLDLIEVKPRIKRTVWLDIYPSSVAVQEFEDGAIGRNRIACVKVEIDCEEGEGL